MLFLDLRHLVKKNCIESYIALTVFYHLKCWKWEKNTCTICCTVRWTDKLVNVVISRTSFDLYWMRFITTAVIPRRTTDFSDDHSIFHLWMTTTEPQWVIWTAHVIVNTWLRHLSFLSIVEKPVPSIPDHIIITSCIIVTRIVDGSPGLIQTAVDVTGVNIWRTKRSYNKELKGCIREITDLLIQNQHPKKQFYDIFCCVTSYCCVIH